MRERTRKSNKQTQEHQRTIKSCHSPQFHFQTPTLEKTIQESCFVQFKPGFLKSQRRESGSRKSFQAPCFIVFSFPWLWCLPWPPFFVSCGACPCLFAGGGGGPYPPCIVGIYKVYEVHTVNSSIDGWSPQAIVCHPLSVQR